MTLQPIPLCMSRAGLLSESQPAARRNVFMAPDHVEDMLAHASARFALQIQKQDRVSISANAMRDMLEELMTGEVNVIDNIPVMRMPDGYMTREYGEWVAIVPALDGWVDCMQRIAPELSSESIVNLGRLIGAGEEITPELVMVARMQLEDQITAMKRLPICAINAAVESTKSDWRAEQKQKKETETMNARDNAPAMPAIDGAINAAHGLLLKSEDALSADDVAKALAIKKTEASKQLRELHGLGLLESEPRKGGTMYFRLAVVAPAKVCDLVQTEGESQTESGTPIDWQAPEMQYLAPEDYVMPPADPVLLASANRMLSDRLERVAHVLRGCGLPALANISGAEDLQMATAALSGAYQMVLADNGALDAERLDINQEVSSLLGIIADIRAAIGDPEGKIMMGELARHIKGDYAFSASCDAEHYSLRMDVAAVSEKLFEHYGPCKLSFALRTMDMLIEAQHAYISVQDRRIASLSAIANSADNRINSLVNDVTSTRRSLGDALNEADRLRAELATERQAREALQEQAGTVEAVGYFVTSASHGPRYFSKRENAIRDAMKNARLGWCTRVIPAGKPIGTARRGAEWRGA